MRGNPEDTEKRHDFRQSVDELFPRASDVRYRA